MISVTDHDKEIARLRAEIEESRSLIAWQQQCLQVCGPPGLPSLPFTYGTVPEPPFYTAAAAFFLRGSCIKALGLGTYLSCLNPNLPQPGGSCPDPCGCEEGSPM